MSGDDLTVSILREIRDELRDVRTEVRDVGSRIDVTNERLDVTNERLDVTNQRLASIETTVQDFGAQHLLLTRFVKNVSDRHDMAIESLETLETKSSVR